jgi:hypothetical protein
MLLFLDPGSGLGKNQDPGSGINIPDPQHLCALIIEVEFCEVELLELDFDCPGFFSYIYFLFVRTFS